MTSQAAWKVTAARVAVGVGLQQSCNCWASLLSLRRKNSDIGRPESVPKTTRAGFLVINHVTATHPITPAALLPSVPLLRFHARTAACTTAQVTATRLGRLLSRLASTAPSASVNSSAIGLFRLAISLKRRALKHHSLQALVA